MSADAAAAHTRHVSNHCPAPVRRSVRRVREIVAIPDRLLGRACIAQARARQDGRSAVAFVVVVMEARSVPIDTPAAEYRLWRLALSRVTHPEINALSGKSVAIAVAGTAR